MKCLRAEQFLSIIIFVMILIAKKTLFVSALELNLTRTQSESFKKCNKAGIMKANELMVHNNSGG